MNLKIYLGKTKDEEDFSLDFAKQNLNLILLVGATGTGKSVFHFQMYKELIKQNRPEEVGFIIIDNTRVDFGRFPEPYLIERNIDHGKSLEVLEKILEKTKERGINKKGNHDAVFVHIEECDQFAADYEKTAAFFQQFISLKHHSNMFVTYSTSRPSTDVLPDWLLEGADLKVVFGLSSEIDCQRVLGNNMALTLKPGERILELNNKLVFCQPFNNEELTKIEEFENGDTTKSIACFDVTENHFKRWFRSVLP